MTKDRAEEALGRPGIRALRNEMQASGVDRDAPVREIFALLGDRWSTLILLVLATGALRHAGLRRVVAHLASESRISQRVLTLKLRALERDGLINRHESADVPPHVTYELSPLGTELAERARGMIDWVRDNRDTIERARCTFAARED